MKNIGIITFTYGDNFGQRLQNLAVQEIINSLGFRGVTIPQDIPMDYEIKNSKRHNYFVEFDNKFINYNEFCISDKTKLLNIDDFEYFVAGSDQIWSPFSNDVNSTMFLRFVPIKKRISYAPSMGTGTIPLSKLLLYIIYLNGFKRISVREKESAIAIKHITRRPVTTLIDPTLMFGEDFWLQYAERPDYEIGDNFNLIYILGKDNHSLGKIFVDDYSQGETIDLSEGNVEFNIGPSQFLYLIKNARYIVTDSYHGVIFSIIFRKKFKFVQRIDKGIDMSVRFTTLFSTLNITDINQNNIDYDTIDGILKMERNKALLYLKECLDIDNNAK